jgi:hypothetical protein
MQPLLAVRGSTTGAFSRTANRRSADLAPSVEHRSLTAEYMDHVHVWVYDNIGADELGIPNSLCTSVF